VGHPLGEGIFLTVRKAIRETLWLLIESPEGGHASTLLFLVCVSPTKAIRLTELRVSKRFPPFLQKWLHPDRIEPSARPERSWIKGG
jgi:hypothetical protein